jgi:tetratricopeptide (TPR) repeat protein
MRMTWLGISAAILASAAASCAGPTDAALTGPTSAPAPIVIGEEAAYLAPLPARALLPLDAIAPKLPAPVTPADAETLPARAAEIVPTAEDKIKRGNFTEAIDILDRARGFAPDSARIRRDLGFAYAGANERGKAEANLLIAAKTAPDNVRLHLLLGQYAELQKQYVSALTHFRTGLLCSDAKGENPDTGETLARLGAALEQQEYYTAALEAYAQLEAMISAHEREYAASAQLKMLATQPERLQVARGRVMLKLHQFADAAKLLDQAYRQDKSNPEAGRLAVVALLAQKDYATAQRIIVGMLAEPAQRELATLSALELARAQKDVRVPAALLHSYTEHGGSDAGFILAMAEVTAELGEVEQARQIIAANLKGPPDNGQAILRLARLQAQLGDLQAAFLSYARLLAEDMPHASQVPGELARLTRQGAGKTFQPASFAGGNDAKAQITAYVVAMGMLAQAQGKADDAVRHFKTAIAGDPKAWRAYDQLEDISFQRKDDVALDQLAADAVKADADGFFRYYLAGKIQFQRGKTGDAVASLEQARTRNARDVATLTLLGEAYIRQGRTTDGERALLSALNVSGDDPRAIEGLFELYLAQHRLGDAQRLVSMVLGRNPRNLTARALLAQYCLTTGRAEQAKSEARKVLKDAPDDVEARLVEIRAGLPVFIDDVPIPAAAADAALAKLRDLLSADAANESANRLCVALLANQGKYAEAAKMLETMCKGAPGDYVLALAWFDALIRAKLEDRATAAIEDLAKNKDLSANVRSVIIDTLVRLKKFDLAHKILEGWLGGAPQAEAMGLKLLNLKLQEAAGWYDKEDALLEQLLNQESREAVKPILQRDRIRVLAKAGQFDQAVAFTRQIIAQSPDNEVGQRFKVILLAALMDAKAFDKAQPLVDEWITAATTAELREDLRRVKLLLYAKEGKFDKLMAYGRQWLNENPLYPPANEAVIAVLIESKKYDDALKLAQEWLAAEQKADKPTAATAPATRPARPAEATVGAMRMVVGVLQAAQRNDEALAKARQFVAQSPDDPKLLRTLYSALATAQQPKEAMTVLEKIYQLDPEDAMLNNDLGYCWADQGVNLDKAQDMLAKAVKDRPESIAVIDSYGWVLYKLGRFEDAAREFERALAGQDPSVNSVIFDHAGDVYWRYGLKEEAVRMWKQAIEAAEKAEPKDADDKKVLPAATEKVKAVRAGQSPKVAPLGEGVSETGN